MITILGEHISVIREEKINSSRPLGANGWEVERPKNGAVVRFSRDEIKAFERDYSPSFRKPPWYGRR